jgi:uncharacterized protein YcbX
MGPIGRVAEIWRYPVKSMRGERLPAVELRWTGIAGDRQFGFVRLRDRSRFPWLTGRNVPRLVLYEPRYADGNDPRNSPLNVLTPDGQDYDIWDPGLTAQIAEIADEPVQLLRLGRGALDQHPVSVISTATLHRLSTKFGSEVNPRRFRMNIVIEVDPEMDDSDWVGASLVFGRTGQGPIIRIDEPDTRCVMITIDPETAERDPKVAELVRENFANQIGHYGAPITLGRIAVGEPIYLQSATAHVRNRRI